MLTAERSGQPVGSLPAPPGQGRRAVVIVGQRPGDTERRVHSLVGDIGWVPVRALDEDNIAWAASVHHPAAIVVVGGSEDWTVRTVRTVRAASEAVVVVLGRLDTLRTVHVLAAGADTVVPEDTRDAELLARLFALVRREPGAVDQASGYLQADGLTLDLRNREVTRDGATVRLTSTEFRLLVLLMQEHGHTVANQKLISTVWGGGTTEGINTLRIFVQRLRRKLGDPARNPQLVACVRGHGYRFLPEVIELAHGRDSGGDATGGLDAVERLASSLAGCRDVGAVSETFVRFLVAGTTVDGVAVHRKVERRLVLQAHYGLSPEWVRHAADLPITGGLAAGAALAAASELVFPVRGPKRFSDTARLLRDEGVASTLFLPFDFGPGATGCVGVTRRASGPWSAGPLGVLRALTALYASQAAARSA
jgi:DNA-binding response OmpR family regulator